MCSLKQESGGKEDKERQDLKESAAPPGSSRRSSL